MIKYDFLRRRQWWKFFLLIALLTSGCSTSTSSEEKENNTFFTGTRNGQSWTGDGLAFSQGDTALHIRGFFGNSGHYQQIDIFISSITVGRYDIETNKASISTLIGGDVIGNIHDSQGNASDYVSFGWNSENTHVSGQFEFSGMGWDSTTVALQGEFRIAVAESGTPWSCGFIEPRPSERGCYFIP